MDGTVKMIIPAAKDNTIRGPEKKNHIFWDPVPEEPEIPQWLPGPLDNDFLENDSVDEPTAIEVDSNSVVDLEAPDPYSSPYFKDAQTPEWQKPFTPCTVDPKVSIITDAAKFEGDLSNQSRCEIPEHLRNIPQSWESEKTEVSGDISGNESIPKTDLDSETESMDLDSCVETTCELNASGSSSAEHTALVDVSADCVCGSPRPALHRLKAFRLN